MYWFVHVIMLLILIAMPYKARGASGPSRDQQLQDAARDIVGNVLTQASSSSRVPDDDDDSRGGGGTQAYRRTADRLVDDAVTQAMRKVSSFDQSVGAGASSSSSPGPAPSDSELFRRICAQQPEEMDS